MKANNQDLLERIPPHSVDIEIQLLGSILIDPRVFDHCLPFVEPGDFYDDANEILFARLAEMSESGRTIDTALLRRELQANSEFERVGGDVYLSRVVKSVAVSSHAVYYAKETRRLSSLRRIIDACSDAMQGAYEEQDSVSLMSELDARLNDIGMAVRPVADGRELAEVALQTLEDRSSGRGEVIQTGLGELDRRIGGGFFPGEFIVLGARSSFGKTALAVNMACNNTIKNQVPTAIASIEMLRFEICDRIASCVGKIDSRDVLEGTLSDVGREKYLEVARSISTAPLYVDDSSTQTLGTIVSFARRMQRQYGVRMLIVDYLQLVDSQVRTSSRERELAAVSRRLKSLAQELGIAIFCLAQLNKEAQDKTPRMHHIRECDAISHEANKVLLLHRPHAESFTPTGEGEDVELIIAKNRSGPRGVVKLLWFSNWLRFEEKAPSRFDVFDNFNEGSV